VLADHKRDAARAENSLTLLYGSEPIGMQRDWNEELQSCREFSHTTPQERYLHFLIHRLITSGVCAFYSLSDDNDLVPFIILLGDFFTAGSCVIGHFIK
jgi:hypothetical protein